MVWNVYKHNITDNEDKIEIFNIFDHQRFHTSVRILRKTSISKEAFIKDLERELMCYFWYKDEYEVTIRGLSPYHDWIKVSVYDQVMLNWNVFANYVWEAAI